MTRRGHAWLAAATALALAVRLPFDLRPLYIVDEAVFALGARAILEGGLVYRDVWDHRGPLLHYVYAVVFALVGLDSMVAVHVVTTGALVLETVLVYRLAAACVSRAAAAGAAFLFAFYSTFGGQPSDTLAANAEIWTNLFVLAGLDALLRALRGDGRWPYALAGVCLGLAAITKQVAYLLYPLPVLAVLLGPAWGLTDRRPALRARVSRLVLLTAGFLAPLAALLGYYAWRGALGDLVTLFVRYNVYYLRAFYTSGSAPAGDVLARLATGLAQTIRTPFSPRYTFALGALASLAVVARVLARRRPLAGLDPVPPQLWLVCAWLALAAVPTLLLGRAFLHYYLLLLPAVCVLAAWLLARALQACAGRPPATLVAGILLAAILLQGIHRQVVDVLVPTPDRSGEILEQVASAVASRTRPDERIFFWGWPTELYVLAHRAAASRFVFVPFLTGLTPRGLRQGEPGRPGYPGASELWLDDLVRRRPKLIIDGHRADPSLVDYPLTRYPHVWRLIESDYRAAQTIESYVIYERIAP